MTEKLIEIGSFKMFWFFLRIWDFMVEVGKKLFLEVGIFMWERQKILHRPDLTIQCGCLAYQLMIAKKREKKTQQLYLHF